MIQEFCNQILKFGRIGFSHKLYEHAKLKRSFNQYLKNELVTELKKLPVHGSIV